MNKTFRESKGWKRFKAISLGVSWIIAMLGLGAAWLSVRGLGLRLERARAAAKSNPHFDI